MKRIRTDGSFLIALLLNMVFNWEGTIPAWILLALHFIIDLPIWWFVGALGVWFLGILLLMGILSLASRCGDTPDKKKDNKNPYSKTSFPGIPSDRP